MHVSSPSAVVSRTGPVAVWKTGQARQNASKGAKIRVEVSDVLVYKRKKKKEITLYFQKKKKKRRQRSCYI